MLIVMHSHATPEEVEAACQSDARRGLRAHALPGAQRTAIGITGNTGAIEPAMFDGLPGVAEVVQVSKAYKLVSREMKSDDTIVRFAGSAATIGGTELALMAGPCSIESHDQAMEAAEQLAEMGVQFFRGGAFKPRTSPYAFQGLGEEALQIMAEIRERFGLLIVTEAINAASIELAEQYADMIQIGARNMQNFDLLRSAGRAGKPILLKRGVSATLDELLMAAEYVMSEGNYAIALCERGIRTFTDHTRNTLDLSIVPAVKRLTHLPIIVDPSHATGQRNKVVPMARAAIAAGADGLMIEVHPHPDEALSDGMQSLFPEQLREALPTLRLIAAAVERTMPAPRDAAVAEAAR